MSDPTRDAKARFLTRAQLAAMARGRGAARGGLSATDLAKLAIARGGDLPPRDPPRSADDGPRPGADQAPVALAIADGLAWFLPGRPVPKGRPRLSVDLNALRLAVMARDVQAARRCFSIRTPQRTVDYERRIRESARVMMRDRAPWDDLVEMDLTFVMRRRGAADLDNLVKAVLDGMNEVLYLDDSQIRMLSTRILVSEILPEGAVIAARVRSDAGAPTDNSVQALVPVW